MTKELKTMKGTKKYIVSNEKNLINPKGYDLNSNVFYKTEIAIHTDNLKDLPKTNCNLYAHKMKQDHEFVSIFHLYNI